MMKLSRMNNINIMEYCLKKNERLYNKSTKIQLALRHNPLLQCGSSGNAERPPDSALAGKRRSCV